MGQKILLGITGGIAAYKAAELVRLFTAREAEIRVVMTRNAAEFVTPLTFQTLSGNPVYLDHFPVRDGTEDPGGRVLHIDLARWADAIVVAPATANSIGKLANGIADDLLSTLLISAVCPLFLAPSMNVEMYRNGAVRRNLEFLRGQGVTVIEPNSGDLICGEVGEGRLPDPARIVEFVLGALSREHDFAGKKILVTAGPTVEFLDPARALTNRSSGKMGVALAEAALERGAEVTLVHGPIQVSPPARAKNISVRTALEMADVLESEFGGTDILIMAAAVSDYRPQKVHETKIKSGAPSLEIRLVPNPDILAQLSKRKTGQILVGFAAETDHHEENAWQKMVQKGLDLIVLNDIGREDIGFQSDFNEVTLIDREGSAVSVPRMEKRKVAHAVLDHLAERLTRKPVPQKKVASLRGRKSKA